MMLFYMNSVARKSLRRFDDITNKLDRHKLYDNPKQLLPFYQEKIILKQKKFFLRKLQSLLLHFRM